MTSQFIPGRLNDYMYFTLWSREMFDNELLGNDDIDYRLVDNTYVCGPFRFERECIPGQGTKYDNACNTRMWLDDIKIGSPPDYFYTFGVVYVVVIR